MVKLNLHGKASQIKIHENNVSQSSLYSNAYPAKNAVNGKGKFAHTNAGVGQWWKAEFMQEIDFTKIRIKNRSDCCGERLAKTKVMISGKLCGSIQNKTETGKWYEVKCNIKGKEVKLVTVQNTWLQIEGVKVYGTRKN